MTMDTTIPRSNMPYVLRFFDPVRQTWLLTPNEMADERQAAVAEIARLQEELARLRAGGSQ